MKKGWETKTLGEIADVKGGKRVPKGYQLQTEPTHHPYITVSDFTDDGTIDTSELRYVSEEIFEQIKRYTISSKDLYLSIAGTIGKTGYVPDELDGANLTENACKLVLHPGTDRDFLHYFTKSADFADQAGANTRTAAQPKLALERLKTIKLCVPPLAEQQRIVGLLDEAFEALATAKANAEKNLQNARAIFQTHLDQFLGLGGNDWKEMTFGDLVVQSRGGISIKSSEYSGSGIPVLTKGDIKPFGEIEHGGKYVDEAQVKKQRWPLADPGDLIVATRDLKPSAPFLGLVSRVPRDRPYLVNQGATYFKVNEELVCPDYFVYWCCCASYRMHVVAKKSGSTQVHIREADLFSAPLNLPTVKDQRLIISCLGELRKETQRLARIYEQRLAALEALKRSLLHQAFLGEL